MSGRARGPLWILALLLAGSAILRVGPEVGKALARSAEPAAPSAGVQCAPDGDLEPVIAALNRRRDLLDDRETALMSRMQALSVADREIDRKLAELVAAEDALSATLALAETAAEDDIGRLTAVYENMKSKQAAALFEEMDPEFSAGFLGRMRPDAAAGIMAGLSPQAAYRISVVLAGRNAKVPAE